MDQELFTLVKKIINEWDPSKLLAIHCPEDEYHSEIKEITTYIKLQENLKDDDLGIYIYKIFKEYLEEQFNETREKIIEISQRIIKEINEWNVL